MKLFTAKIIIISLLLILSVKQTDLSSKIEAHFAAYDKNKNN